MKYILLVVFAVMSVQVATISTFPEKEYAIAQEASPSPSADPKLVGEIKKSGDVFEDIQGAMLAKEGIIGMILLVLFGIAKRFSTDKAPMIINYVQMLFDALAFAMNKLGNLLKAISDMLAKAIASDGYLGKK